MRQTPIQLALSGLALFIAIVALGLNIFEAIQQDVWGKAHRWTIVLILISVAAFLVIVPNIWLQYVKQQPPWPMSFISLAVVTIAILSAAWRFLAQATCP